MLQATLIDDDLAELCEYAVGGVSTRTKQTARALPRMHVSRCQQVLSDPGIVMCQWLSSNDERVKQRVMNSNWLSL